MNKEIFARNTTDISLSDRFASEFSAESSAESSGVGDGRRIFLQISSVRVDSQQAEYQTASHVPSVYKWVCQ